MPPALGLGEGRPAAALRAVTASAVLCVAAACVSVSYVQTGDVYPPKPAECDIEVFSAGPPDRAYEELGIVEGEGSFWQAELRDIVPRLREEACRAGGDAIVLLSAQRVASGEDDFDDEELHAFATVIRWVD